MALKWVKASDGHVPDNAVEGGKDPGGLLLYVGRAWHGTRPIPGKVATHLGGCMVPDDGRGHLYTNYEVLVRPATGEQGEVFLEWRKCSYGRVPSGAVNCGEYYVGRALHAGYMTPGKVDVKKQCLLLCGAALEAVYKHYDVLTQTVVSPNQYRLYDVCYNMDDVKQTRSPRPICLASKVASNNSNKETTVMLSVSYTKVGTLSWRNEWPLRTGVKTTVMAGTPYTDESGKLRFTPSTVHTLTSGDTYRENENLTTSTSVKLEPWQFVRMNVMATKEALRVPYTARLVSYLPSNGTRTRNVSGVFEGSHYIDIKTNCGK